MSTPDENLPIRPGHEAEAQALGYQLHAMVVRERLRTIMQGDGIENIVETATHICQKGVGISAIMIKEQKNQMMQMDVVLSGMNGHEKTQFVMWQLAVHPEVTALSYPWRPEHEDKMTEAYYTMLGYMIENGLFDVSSLKIDCYGKLGNIYGLIDKINKKIDTPDLDILIETLKKELIDFGVDAGVISFMLPGDKFEAFRACLALWTITKIIEGNGVKKFAILENKTHTVDGHGFAIGCDQIQPLAFMISLEFLLPDENAGGARNDFAQTDMRDFVKLCLSKLLTPNGKNFLEICFGNAMESLIIRTESEPVDTDATNISKRMRGNLGEK